MTQEVQTTLDYKAELNLIQGVWYQERKISDKMQVTDKKSNQITADGSVYLANYTDASPGSFTTQIDGDVIYRVSGGTIYLPDSGAYLFQYIPNNSYNSSYYYTITAKLDWQVVYSERLMLADHETRSAMINGGKRNALTLTFSPERSAASSPTFTIKLIKL